MVQAAALAPGGATVSGFGLALMRRTGLDPVRALGGADGSAYSKESRRLVLVAARRGG
jgi:hypothetical protein